MTCLNRMDKTLSQDQLDHLQSGVPHLRRSVHQIVWMLKLLPEH